MVFGTRWELNPGRGIRIPHRVPLHHGPTDAIVVVSPNTCSTLSRKDVVSLYYCYRKYNFKHTMGL